jgi:general secretion pathway protein I
MKILFSRRTDEAGGSGFTLLEVMVAMSMIAIALTAVFHVQFQNIMLNNTARFDVAAPLLAKSRMAAIQEWSGDPPEEDSGDFGEARPGYRWHYVIENVESEILDTDASRLERIDLTVSAGEDEYTYMLRSYRMIPDDGV